MSNLFKACIKKLVVVEYKKLSFEKMLAFVHSSAQAFVFKHSRRVYKISMFRCTFCGKVWHQTSI